MTACMDFDILFTFNMMDRRTLRGKCPVVRDDNQVAASV